jgi:ubiquinone/menaquinone biosynthesis C-methylase UbiE
VTCHPLFSFIEAAYLGHVFQCALSVGGQSVLGPDRMAACFVGIMMNWIGKADMTSTDFSYNRFAANSWYQALNVHLVELAQIQPGQKIVDLACGPGSVTKIILEKVRDTRDSMVIGIDMSSSALKQAQEDLSNAGNAFLNLAEGRAEDLTRLVRDKMDTVVFCNAIHLVEDKSLVMREISDTLRPGGIFAFNSSFFKGDLTDETSQFYRRWMMRSLRILKKDFGLKPSKDKVLARQALSIGEYTEILEDNHFKVSTTEIEPVNVPLEGWQDISYFEDFIAGALPGVPLEAASYSLVEAAAQIFNEFDLSSVRRDWLSVVAVRQ